VVVQVVHDDPDRLPQHAEQKPEDGVAQERVVEALVDGLVRDGERERKGDGERGKRGVKER
jgi:hypothetical protein